MIKRSDVSVSPTGTRTRPVYIQIYLGTTRKSQTRPIIVIFYSLMCIYMSEGRRESLNLLHRCLTTSVESVSTLRRQGSLFRTQKSRGVGGGRSREGGSVEAVDTRGEWLGSLTRDLLSGVVVVHIRTFPPLRLKDKT